MLPFHHVGRAAQSAKDRGYLRRAALAAALTAAVLVGWGMLP